MDNKLNPTQQETLLQLARKAITFYLDTGDTLEKDISDNSFLEQRGAFVTLKVRGELRGCIGYPIPFKSLYETTIDAAVSAASSDPRFKPLTAEDLQETKIEISVLTAPRPVKDIQKIIVGVHGIVISKGYNKGLLLPQVPIEWKWDLETYLEHGCLKAGLDKDEWKKGVILKLPIF